MRLQEAAQDGFPRRLLIVALVTALAVLCGVVIVGLPEIVQQIIQFRLASRSAEGWRLGANLSWLRSELAGEGLMLLLLAALGAAVSARRPVARLLIVWFLAAAVTILIHSPLHTKHFVVVIVPVVALAAFAATAIFRCEAM